MYLARQMPSRRSTKAKSRPSQVISLGPYPLGINTVLGPNELQDGEMSNCVNFRITPMGGLQTRPGLTKYTNTALANQPSHICNFPLSGDIGGFLLFTDSDDFEWTDSVHDDTGATMFQWMDTQPAALASDELIVTYPDNKLYYLDSNKNPQLIATLEGEATLVPFGNYALVLDGSYIKIWDRANATLILAYDDGTGTNGYQHNNTGLTSDTVIELYSGGNTKAGSKFITQYWDTGYTITATEVKVYAKAVGSPTGNVGCEIYTSAGVLLATSTTTYDSATIDTTAELLSFTFDSGAMAPETEYWAVITYSGGAAANRIELECDTVASGGDVKYYDGSWNSDTTKYGLVAAKPGRPPKAQFGLIKGDRAYVAGDNDNPGWMWYCNVLTPFDWSTSDGGGYVGAVDENSNTFPIGAIVRQYGDIYVFGKADDPYMCKLNGASPTDYVLNPLFQNIYATHKAAISVKNDIWFGNESGVDTLSGVEQYGDLRAYSESDPIQNILDTYWTDAEAFAKYNSISGQYLLKLNNYSRVLVAHTKNPIRDELGRIRYPWTQYLFIRDDLTSATYKWTASGSGTNEYYLELAAGGDPSITQPGDVLLDDSIITEGTAGSLTDHQWDYANNDSLGYSTIYIRDDSGDPDSSGVQVKTILVPTAFAHYDNKTFIGCDDGFIYYLDPSVLDDNTKDVSYLIAGKLHEIPFAELCLDRYHVLCEHDGSGATFHFQIFNEDQDIDSIHSATADADFTVTHDTRKDGDINFNVQKFMGFLREIDPNDSHLRIERIALETSLLSK